MGAQRLAPLFSILDFGGATWLDIVLTPNLNRSLVTLKSIEHHPTLVTIYPTWEIVRIWVNTQAARVLLGMQKISFLSMNKTLMVATGALIPAITIKLGK